MDQNLQNYKQSCDSKHSNSWAPIEIAEKILDFLTRFSTLLRRVLSVFDLTFYPPSSFESQTLFVIDSELTFHPLLTIFVFFRKQLRRKWGEAQ